MPRRQEQEDPYEFETVPDRPEEEARRPTEFDPEWKNHKALLSILTRQAVPGDQIADIISAQPMDSMEDLATLNARLFTLGEQYGIPRWWLVKEVEKKSKRAKLNSKEIEKMSWLKHANPLESPEMTSRYLPTKSQPGLKGPIEDEGPPAIPGLLEKKPGLEEKMEPRGIDKVKSLLDKGDLKAAMEELKKMVPEKPRAPFLGDEKKEEKPGAEDKAPAAKEEAPAVAEELKAAGRVDYECGRCHALLEIPESLSKVSAK